MPSTTQLAQFFNIFEAGNNTIGVSFNIFEAGNDTTWVSFDIFWAGVSFDIFGPSTTQLA